MQIPFGIALTKKKTKTAKKKRINLSKMRERERAREKSEESGKIVVGGVSQPWPNNSLTDMKTNVKNIKYLFYF